MSRLAIPLLALLAFAASAGSARAELVTPADAGHHRVEHEVWIDLGRFVECDTWTYALREGDTLGEVAERELGTSRRLREVMALNPGVDPRKVRPGQVLTMPPRRLGCDRAVERFVFFAWTPDDRGWSAPRRLDAGQEHMLGHGARLFAIPVGFLSEVCEASGNRPLCVKVLTSNPRVARSATVRLLWTLPDGDPARRIVTRMRVASVADGKIRFEGAGEVRYGAEGQVLARPKADSSRPSTALQALLFLLMVAGTGWGLHAGLRRNDASLRDASASEAALSGGGDPALDDDYSEVASSEMVSEGAPCGDGA